MAQSMGLNGQKGKYTMYNQCQFIGNLGADAEIKAFQSGGRIANLRLAVSESWKDKDTGERKERTEWVSVVITADGLVNLADRYLRKGTKLFVSGKMRTRKWQDSTGNDRYTTEIIVDKFDGKLVMLSGKQEGEPQFAKQAEPDSAFGELDDNVPW